MWGLASTSECLLPYGPPPGTKSTDSGHGPHASTHLLHVVPQFFLEFFGRGEFLGSVGGTSEGGRDEKAQGFLQEQGGFSVAVAATPIIGHSKVKNHPLGYRKEGKERWDGGRRLKRGWQVPHGGPLPRVLQPGPKIVFP